MCEIIIKTNVCHKPVLKDTEDYNLKIENFSKNDQLDLWLLYFGFTEEETRVLCEQYQMDFEECKRWYNGYKMDFLDDAFEIYNPKSVVQAMATREFGGYWTKTGSYDSIRTYISMR